MDSSLTLLISSTSPLLPAMGNHSDVPNGVFF